MSLLRNKQIISPSPLKALSTVRCPLAERARCESGELHFPALSAALNVFAQEQAVYIGFAVEKGAR